MVGVHVLAIAGVPILFLGAMALSRRLNAPHRLSLIGLVFYALGLIAVVIAAAISGFVGTEVLREMIKHGANGGTQWHLLMAYNFRINQAFAAIFSNATCVAIVLWSGAIVKERLLPVGLGIYGLILGSVVIILLAMGWMRLDVHGEGLIVFGEAIWFIAAAISLWRLADEPLGAPAEP
jgi:hypothetical protein